MSDSFDDGGPMHGMPANDIAKHPLWREHHGSMEGWRYLERKEKVQLGDENNWIMPRDYAGENRWLESGLPAGSNQVAGIIYRRRIAPATEAMKRFVTVIFEAGQIAQCDLAHMPEYVGMKFAQIREGNYLEKFDGMEQNVIEAMRKGKVGV